MSLTVVTEPTEEPLTLDDLALHLRLDDIQIDEPLLLGFLMAARARVETETRRQLVTATYALRLDAFPGGDGVICLPKPPLQSVTSIAYIDTAGDSQTLDASAYQVDIYATPGRVEPAYSTAWPSTRAIQNAVTITYVAGYGDPAVVPRGLKAAIQMIVADLYEHREEQFVGTIRALNPSAEALVTNLKIPRN